MPPAAPALPARGAAGDLSHRQEPGRGPGRRPGGGGQRLPAQAGLEERASNAELARFNYTVAHDLKNPLTTIRNFIGLLEKDAEAGDHDRLRSDLRRIDVAATKLHRLLDQLYEFSRIDRVSMPCEEVAFGDLVGQALADLAPLIAERGVEVEVAADLPVVCGDRARLLEAVRHLLDNAVRYLGDQPAPRIEVGVRAAEAPGEPPIFYVRDNGMGIEPKYQEKVFGLFERLDPEASAGTGIGLALVKRIVEVHGGRVWVESEGKGRGAMSCFSLLWSTSGEGRQKLAATSSKMSPTPSTSNDKDSG
ncbi:MAG: hypothetical protein GY929_24420 [Actinomycetia bacterium]|nr:hypothetical protein [Actinomycetes bacterium]